MALLYSILLTGRLGATLVSVLWFRAIPWLASSALATLPFLLLFNLATHQSGHGTQAQFLLSPSADHLLQLLLSVKEKSPARARTLANTYTQDKRYQMVPSLPTQLLGEETVTELLKKYDAQLQKSPTHSQLLWNKNLLLESLGKTEEAEAMRNQALEFDPQLQK
jgi:hypothetical protein